MISNLKKNWFVVVVAVILLIATGFYVKDQVGSVLREKTADGKQVVFTIAGQNYFADEFQKELDKQVGDSALYQVFERELLKNIETSDAIATQAKETADNHITYVKQSAGQKGLDQLDKELIGYGYDGIESLQEYYANSLKYKAIVTEYFLSHYDRLFKEDVDKNKPRLVSHILVSIEDAENPTEEELEKIEKIEKALEEGNEFGSVAALYSDDTESAKVNGSIGVVNAESSLVKPFLEAMLLLDKGEVSAWVETDFGKHLIKIDETEFKTLLENDDFFAEVTSNQGKEVGLALWEKSKTLDFVFASETVENRIKGTLGILEVEDDN